MNYRGWVNIENVTPYYRMNRIRQVRYLCPNLCLAIIGGERAVSEDGIKYSDPGILSDIAETVYKIRSFIQGLAGLRHGKGDKWREIVISGYRRLLIVVRAGQHHSHITLSLNGCR